MRRSVCLTAMAALLAAGCGSTASITRADGVRVRARIVDSDASGLLLQGRSDGPVSRMERSDISGVSHPGKTTMFVGAGLVGVWGLFMTSPTFRDELVHGYNSDVSVMARPITLLLTVPAVILMAWGSSRYLASTRAASAFDAAEPMFEIAPRQPDAPPSAPLIPPAALAPIPPAAAHPPGAAPAPPIEPSTRSPARWVAPPPPA